MQIYAYRPIYCFFLSIAATAFLDEYRKIINFLYLERR